MKILDRLKPNKFWSAVATLTGATVGIGFYGIAFSFQKAGLIPGLLFFILVAAISLLTNLIFGEIILRTHQRHQFVGYVNKYLGNKAKTLNLFIFWVAMYGALVGIIIIIGEFLSNILGFFLPFSQFTYSSIFVLAASLVVMLGLRAISRFDFFMFLIFAAVVLSIVFINLGKVSLAATPYFDKNFWFLPFGVILFSLGSSSGVPLMREVLVGQERKLKKAIIIGTLMPALFYLVFALFVIGISSDLTSPDAISGLRPFLGSTVVFIGSLLGFLTSSSIFLNVTTVLKETIEEDFRFKKKGGWLLAMIPPYLLYLFGLRNFIDVIDLVGGVAVGLSSILMIFLYIKTKKNGERIPEYSVWTGKPILYFMILFFSLAALYTVFAR